MSTEQKKKSNDLKVWMTKKELETLKSKKGFHTELISLYIPPGRQIYAMNHLKNEVSESQNIKSKLTRKNVLDGIYTLQNRLKVIKDFPENGLVMFSGAIPQNNTQGTERRETFIIDPPELVKTFKYYCAAEFYLEPLEKMLQAKETYGLIVIGRKESAVGYLRGTHMVMVREFTSGIHGKHRAGGQSQRRYERLIEEGEKRFYRRISDEINKLYLNMEELHGIFIGGPGPSKEKFVNDESLDYRLREKILDVVDLGYSGAEGLRALVDKVKDQIENVKYIREKKVWQRFMKEITSESGLATYGLEEVKKVLDMGAVDVLVFSEKIDLYVFKIECSNCGYVENRTIKENKINELENKIQETHCPQCDSTSFKIIENKSIIEEFGAIAETMGTQIEILSSETEEGEMLYSTFGGLVAILRFKIGY